MNRYTELVKKMQSGSKLTISEAMELNNIIDNRIAKFCRKDCVTGQDIVDIFDTMLGQFFLESGHYPKR